VYLTRYLDNKIRFLNRRDGMDKRAFKEHEKVLYTKEWNKIVSLLKRSTVDLSKIRLVADVRRGKA
jgi:hypothetical protein